MSRIQIDTSAWLQAIDEKLKQLDQSIEALFTPPFEIKEVSTFLSAAIKVADDLLADGTEEDKIALVMEMWDYYDNEYNLVQKLDDAVDFKDLLGSVIGGAVEQVDGLGIRMLVEKLLIPILVKAIY